MRNLFILAAGVLIAMGCEKTDITNNNTPNSSREVTVSVKANSNDDTTEQGVNSRVTATETATGNLNFQWKEGDKLGGWSVGSETASLSEFTMSDFDAEESTFEGSITGDSYRLVHPYDANTSVDNSAFTINIATQQVDMQDDGFGAMGDYTYMLSDVISADDDVMPSMKHLTAVVNVSMRFTALPNSDAAFTIKSVSLGNTLVTDPMPYMASVDLTKSVTEEGSLTVLGSDNITAYVSNSPEVKVYSEDDASTTYSVKFNILPYELGEGSNLPVTVTLESEGVAYAKEFSITNSSGEVKEFARSTYTGVNVLCDMSEATEVSNWVDLAARDYAGGKGTIDEPYLISTPEQLAILPYLVNDGTPYAETYFELTNDIDLAGYEWTAIGKYVLNNYNYCFKGNFNGRGYTIKNMNINKPDTDCQGLFGYIYAATIRNVNVEGSVIGKEFVGGLIGRSLNTCVVVSCSNAANVSGYEEVGGLVGGMSGGSMDISGCYNSGTISSDNSFSGGIIGSVGQRSATVRFCYNSGQIGSAYADGAIVGYENKDDGISITDCYYLSTSAVRSVYSQKGNDYTYIRTLESDFMTSDDFTSSMNYFTSVYNATDATYKAYAWRKGEDGYPVFDRENYSASGENLIPAPSISDDDIYLNGDVYEIKTALGLQEFASKVNSGSDAIKGMLMNDIDLSSVCSSSLGSWDPIGNSYSDSFNGTFDGAGYTISNLYIEGSETCKGLFGAVLGGAVIKGIMLKNVDVSGSSYVAGLVGRLQYSQAIGCAVISGTVTASSNNSAGLVGYTYEANISACYSAARVISSSYNVGGIVGNFQYGLTVTSCFNTGLITTSSSNSSHLTQVGGLIGYVGDSSTFTNCYWLYNSECTQPNYGIGYASTSSGDDGDEVVKATSIANINTAVETMNASLTDCDYYFVKGADDDTIPSLVKKVDVD